MSFNKIKFTTLFLLFVIVLVTSSCANKEKPMPIPTETPTNVVDTPAEIVAQTPETQILETETPVEVIIQTPENATPTEIVIETPVETPQVVKPEEPSKEKPPIIVDKKPEPTVQKPTSGRLIVIDAGHQAKGNSAKEPNGPGSSAMKAKVSSGTKGVSTGLYEYELNLDVTFKLQKELERRGYHVLLVRSSHQVDISNVQRAEFANENGADAFIRIHANGSDDQSVHGALTICQTSSNPYNAATYKQSYSLSEKVLKQMVLATGAKDRGVWQTDTMTGINWSKVPSTIVEMGFMSNPKEDDLLATGSYQDKIVQGISNGIDAYFSN